MRKIMLIMIYIISFIAQTAFAGTVEIGRNLDNTPIFITYDDKYSFKNFTQRNLLDATDLEGKVIYASSFSQENPDTKVFSESVKKIIFYNCNLDNVKLNKPGWEVNGGSQRKYKVQNDLKDWEVDDTGKPVKVLNEEDWIKKGYSVDPAKIPPTKIKDIEDGPKTVIISDI